MTCPNCKGAINGNLSECEWCNFIFSNPESNTIESDSKLLNKGECIFFSKRIAKKKCFYELYNHGLKLVDTEENLNLFIKKEIIYNVEHYGRFKSLHFIPPILGSIIRFIILIFSKYKRGFSIITSKSGKNVLIIKKTNYKAFKLAISNYV